MPPNPQTRTPDEENDLAAARASRLEAQLADAQSQLARRERELAALRAGVPAPSEPDPEVAELRQRLSEAEQNAGIASEEVAAALRQLERAERRASAYARRARDAEAGAETTGKGLASRATQAETSAAALQLELDSARVALGRLEADGRRSLTEYTARTRELEQVVSIQAFALRETKKDIERVEQSRAWRFGHAVMRTMSRLALRKSVTEGALVSAAERLDRVDAAARGLPAGPPARRAIASPGSAEDEEAPAGRATALPAQAADRERFAEELRQRLGPAPERLDWPAVSLVVAVSGARAERLERLLDGLRAHTDYPSLEMVVLAEDGTTVPDLGRGGIEARVVRHGPDLSWAEVAALGAAHARDDRILICDEGLEPFERGWLRELVAAHDREGAGAAGPLLLRAGTPDVERKRGLAHRSVRLRGVRGRVEPFDDGAGAELTADATGADRPTFAVSRACLLVDRRVLRSAGGLAAATRGGGEDVDIGLRLLALGRDTIGVGRSVAYHRSDAEDAFDAVALQERWGPGLRRAYRTARLRRDPFWTDGAAPHVGCVDADVAATFEAKGWRVSRVATGEGAWSEVADDLDYVVSTPEAASAPDVPAGITRIALGAPADADVVVAADEALLDALMQHEERLSFCLRIEAPTRAKAERWGDLPFAQALERSLRSRGHRCLIQTLDQWNDVEGLAYDVVVHLKGSRRMKLASGQLNVLWSISHPADLTGEECDAYDLVCVASPSFATQMRDATRTPIVVLEQATDPAVFYPDPDPALAHDLVYVANSRGVLRPIVRDLLPTEHDLAIWGANWDGLIDTGPVQGEHMPNDRLRRVYSSAGVVLNDHWDDMRAHGYISNRVYDAVACGAVVVSDDVGGLAERFGDAVVTFQTPAELSATVARLLEAPDERRRRARDGRERILAAHTFDHRAQTLIEAVRDLSAEGAGRASLHLASAR